MVAAIAAPLNPAVDPIVNDVVLAILATTADQKNVPALVFKPKLITSPS